MREASVPRVCVCGVCVYLCVCVPPSMESRGLSPVRSTSEQGEITHFGEWKYGGIMDVLTWGLLIWGARPEQGEADVHMGWWELI